jgi:beta-galactosidase/beta-glucuronidase
MVAAMSMLTPDAISRGEHPRPLLQRDGWRSLNGRWEFALDPAGVYNVPSDVAFDRTIEVPFPPESVASGIHETGFHNALWYRRRVRLLPLEMSQRLLLHFGAIDYRARVWVNGMLVARHRGGHTPFWADVTEARGGKDTIEIVVRCDDDPQDLAKPRGKQDWLPMPHEIWYPRTSGIWQTVWLEPAPALRIERLRWTPHLDRWEIGLDAGLSESATCTLRVLLRNGSSVLADDRYAISGVEIGRRIALSDAGIDDYRNQLLWSPSNPSLIEAEVELIHEDRVVDRIWSYTALRSVGTQGDRFMLNGRPYYLRMVLDQGYWPDTLLAPPDSTALRHDVELAISFGFNGVRKHQKLEDPRWLYWCDHLGLLVWAEMPSPYRFTGLAVERLVTEWIDALRRDLSHPCIAAWVPLNESWGVPDLPTNPAHREYVRALYHLTKTIDPTRPVIGNDGWEHIATDIVTIHDYASNPRIIAERYASPESILSVLQRQQPGGRPLMLDEFAATNHPVILSEFGGIALTDPEHGGWGYSRVSSDEQLLGAYTRLMEAVHGTRGLAGFCYTQLTDTFQEQNGLANARREPKSDPAKLATATRGRRRAQAMDVDPEPELFAPRVETPAQEPA